MTTVPMPTPPEGHYWRIDTNAYGSPYRRVNLVKPRRWWPDKVIQWSVFRPVKTEHANAFEAAKAARFALEKYHEDSGNTTSGLNGLTGYVDHRGRTR